MKRLSTGGTARSLCVYICTCKRVVSHLSECSLATTGEEPLFIGVEWAPLLFCASALRRFRCTYSENDKEQPDFMGIY